MARSATEAVGKGWLLKCVIGSETLKYKRPIPIPAENNIENQENILKSGLAFLPPSLIFPYLLNANQRHTTTKKFTPSIKSQPVFVVMVVAALSKKTKTSGPPKMATITKARINTMEGKKTLG